MAFVGHNTKIKHQCSNLEHWFTPPKVHYFPTKIYVSIPHISVQQPEESDE